jgi:PAS domain S-box-containing protein
VARFRARVQQELGAQGLEFNDAFLDDVLAALRAGVYPPAARHVRHAHAQAHGVYRRASGAEVTALVREFGLLRDCLFELLEEQHLAPALRELRILDECVSAAVTDAVAAYVAASEQALRESGALLQALLDRAPVAIYVKDREGRYTLVNAHFCSALQVTREQTLGHTDHELFSPAQAEAVRANDAQVLRENAALEREEVVRHRDGPHTYLTIKFPIPGEDGHPEAVGGISTDLTERKRAEDARAFFIEAGRALAESLDFEVTLKTLARLAVERLADFCMLDLLGEDGQLHRLEVASRDPALTELIERTRAYPPRMGSGHPVARVVETGRPLAVAAITPAWLDASASDAEHRATLEALAPRSAVVAPLVAHGRTLGVVNLASRDPERCYGPDELALVQAVADRAAVALANARLYRQAQEAVRTREDVLAIVSHDLKSPLGVVGMTAGQLLRHAGADERGRRTARYAQTIQRSAERMSRLIRDLLDVASIESGTLGLEPRRQEAAALLHEVVEALAPLAQDKGLRLLVAATGDPLHVHADRERVIQVLSNVVGNALKYAPAGSHVALRCERLDGTVRFEVHDEGPGIDAEQLPHIFERFWKAGPARGTGLGLFICRGIVEGHGGRIWAQSAPGHGTRVFFTLPLYPEA